VSGSLRVRGASHRVVGRAWLDHEWSSELLPEGAQGWDWVGLNLDDGSALMAFRMRGKDGRALWTAATVRPAAGAARVLAPDAVAFEALRDSGEAIRRYSLSRLPAIAFNSSSDNFFHFSFSLRLN